MKVFARNDSFTQHMMNILWFLSFPHSQPIVIMQKCLAL